MTGPTDDPTDDPITVVIADDHPVVRDGLAAMFTAEPDIEVVGEAADGAEAVSLAAARHPDVILMDLRMPRLDGLAAIAELVRGQSRARVIVLTTYDADADVIAALDAGAVGYLLKDARRTDLVAAVRAAAAGQTVLSPAVTRQLLRGHRADDHRGRRPAEGLLSDREREVLALVADGSTNQQVASRLFISQATVKSHLLNIYAKLGVNDRAAAVAQGLRRGLLPSPGDR
jgi:DNA-binding NarL/FixJ family response regulator